MTIYKRYFYQSDCYTSGTVITPTGIQVHSTGANNPNLKRYVQPDDGRIGVNTNGNHHNRPGGNVCASAYIGKQADGTVAVYEALPWNYRCWLSGSGPNGNANRLGYIGFEICEDSKNNKNYFDDAVMGQAVLLTAYLCQEYGIPVERVHDHHELHNLGLASNHADITHWTSIYGLKMTDFRAAVQSALDEGIEASYIDCDVVSGLYDAKTVNPGTYLNLRAGPGQNYASIARIPQGAIVSVLDDSNSEWWECTYQSQTGYAMSKYLERLDDPGTPEEDPEEAPEEDETPVLKETVEIPLSLAMQLYNALGDQLCIDARSGNVSNIDYQ